MNVFNLRADGQAILGEADAAVFQVGANLLMLRAVEAVSLQQAGERELLG